MSHLNVQTSHLKAGNSIVLSKSYGDVPQHTQVQNSLEKQIC